MDEGVKSTRGNLRAFARYYKPHMGLFLLDMLCALIVGGFTLFNGGGNRFSLMAARSLEASIQFPIISASVIVLTALMGWACFKERLRTGDFVSIILAGAGIACFAL